MHLNRIFYRARVPKPLFLILFCSVLHADTIPVTVAGSTETQIEVNYTATSTAACTIAATDQNNGPAVNDLDPAKFPGANQDLSRTVANGFRWPALCGGFACSSTNTDVHRTVFIGGHDEIKQGSDGKWYSTSLQVNSPHTITVACNGGADTGTKPVQTHNVPLASYYPETIIPQANTPLGSIPQFTVDWTRAGRTAKYIDPITGVLLQRITGPDDDFGDGTPADSCFYGMFSAVVVDYNSAWTTASNIGNDAHNFNLGNAAFCGAAGAGNTFSTATASTSTVGAVLFVPFKASTAYRGSFIPPGGNSWTDWTAQIFGYASATGLRVNIGLSTDSGQTVSTFNPGVDIALASASAPGAAANWAPCNTSAPCAPSANFSGWGGFKTAFGAYDLRNLHFTGVNISGTGTVTIPAPVLAAGQFNLFRVPGSKFNLSACATGTTPTAPLTVSHVDSEHQITTVETAAVATGCTYDDMSVGIRVVSKDAGTVHVSLYMNGWDVANGSSGSNGGKYLCGPQKVSVPSGTDCDGNTGVPLSGFLCGFPAGGVYFVQDNGRMCLQSNYYKAAGANNRLQPPLSSVIPFVNATTFVLGDSQNPPHVWQATHNATNYAEMPPDPAHTNVNDRFTYVDKTSVINLNANVIAAGGAVGAAVASGLWPAFTLDAVLDDGLGGQALVFRSFGGGGDSECMMAFVDAGTFALKSTAAMFGAGDNPYPYAACHFSPEGGGGYLSVNSEAESGQLGPLSFNNTVLLSGPFKSYITGGVLQNGSTFKVNTFTVTAATQNVAPTTLTISDVNIDNVTAMHASQGALVNCSGATGGWTVLNGNLFLHRTGSGIYTAFSDALGTTGVTSPNTAFAGQTVTCTTSPAIYSLPISAVVNNGGNARFAVNLAGEPFQTRYTSASLTNVVANGDPVAVTHDRLSGTTQYYMKLVDSSHFDLFTDFGLTSPVSFATAAGWTNWWATYAQTCPAQASVTLPGPMYMDTTAWVGGTPKVRCLTVMLNGEFYSDFPKAGETTTYPASGAGRTSQSMIKHIAVGDGAVDLANAGQAEEEVWYTLASNCNSGFTSCTVTYERVYSDDPNYLWRGCTHGIGSSTNGPPCFGSNTTNQHQPGFTLRGSSTVVGGLMGFNTSPVTNLVPRNGGVHGDIVGGATPGNLTVASTYAGGAGIDGVTNVPPSTYVTSFGNTHNSMPFFGLSASFSLVSYLQNYPSERYLPALAPPSELILKDGVSVQRWKADWAAMNSAFGNSQNNVDNTGLSTNLTLVSGLTNTYKVGPIASPVNIKVAPLYFSDVAANIYTNKSSAATGNQIGDADLGSYCLALVANECRTGSAGGDLFLSARGFFYDGAMRSNNSILATPAAFGLWPGAGWAIQSAQYPIDTTANTVRRLTMGFVPPLSHWSFSNWIPSPDAKWGFFASNPSQQRSNWQSSEGTQWWAMKLPPWPNVVDNVDRTKYVSVPVKVGGASGDQIRVAFGYAENGDPAKLYCTTRQETCWAYAAATPLNAFLFAGETQNKIPCNLGCSVSIPAIPGRIVFYQVERSNGTDVRLGPIQAAAIP
jgi:hypothetical protein